MKLVLGFYELWKQTVRIQEEPALEHVGLAFKKKTKLMQVGRHIRVILKKSTKEHK